MFDSAQAGRRALRRQLRRAHGTGAVLQGYSQRCKDGKHAGSCIGDGTPDGCKSEHTSCLCWCHDVRPVSDGQMQAFLSASATTLGVSVDKVDVGGDAKSRVTNAEAKALSDSEKKRVDAVVTLQNTPPQKPAQPSPKRYTIIR